MSDTTLIKKHPAMRHGPLENCHDGKGALDLTLKLSIPVVLVGSQRPLSGLSSDAPANLVGSHPQHP